MALDIYRRQARNLAWYDEDGEASSHNPFKKFRRNPRRTNSIQLAERGGQSRSMGDLRLSEDQRRRGGMNRNVGGPEYSGTFPPESAGSDQHTNGPDPSTVSQEPINVSRDLDLGEETSNSNSAKPRKRKMWKFGRHSDDKAPEDSKSMTGKPVFTVASQLRATIFNSWINVLIVAAPVGSMLNLLLDFAIYMLTLSYSRLACCSCPTGCHLRGQLHRYHVRLA